MKYDFDTIVNRRGTTSLKWDVAENELPMWVADMDFKTAPEILEALQERLNHGVFRLLHYSGRMVHIYYKLVEGTSWPGDGKRLAGILYRSGACAFQSGKEADNAR